MEIKISKSHVYKKIDKYSRPEGEFKFNIINLTVNLNQILKKHIFSYGTIKNAKNIKCC